MKNLKILFLISFLGIGFLIPKVIFSFTSSEITNHQAPEIFIYPQEFDKLVLDLTIPSGREGEEDKILAMVIQNNGSAHNLREISKVILWQEAREQGFQGMGIDEKIGEFNFYNPNSSWYLDNLDLPVPANGLRIFISIETMQGVTSNTTIKMKIPSLDDLNNNGIYDLGELGIFMESENNGPSDNLILNQYTQTIRTFIVDNLPPKTVISAPLNNSITSTTTLTIKGKARDQGGSTVQWVKIGINDIWYDVTPTDSHYLSWEYNWENIAEGTYVLKTKSADWLENIESPGEGISVERIVEPVGEEEEEEVPEEEEEEEEEEEVVEKPIEEMTIEEIKVKIDEILAMIAQLRVQLAELIGVPYAGCTITSFDRNLQVGITGDDVKCLQIILNSNTDTQLATSGPGSPGEETFYFGSLTKAAVIKFQEKYAEDILASWGLTAGTGFVGSTSRDKLNELLGG